MATQTEQTGRIWTQSRPPSRAAFRYGRLQSSFWIRLINEHSMWQGMECPIRGDVGIFFALFVIALSASLPVGALYWLMRPTALPNPGISAYQAPRSDPTIPRIPSSVYESYALSITAAKRENDRPHAKSRPRFAASTRQASSGRGRVAMVQQTQQRSARRQRLQFPWPTVQQPPSHSPPSHSWAFGDRDFGTWYR